MTSPRRLPIVLVALALLVGACSSGGSTSTSGSTSTAPHGSTARSGVTTTSRTEGGGKAKAKPAAVGTYAVGLASFAFEDPSRSTPANGTYEAHPGRKLPVLAWYPSGTKGPGGGKVPDAVKGAQPGPGHFPVIIFSHGVTGKATFYNAPLRAWASAGYVVVAPDYPLSNLDAPGGPTVIDVGQQPADASFVLDQFVGPAAKRPPATATLAAHVDAAHIAAVGHSLGAITSLGIGYGTCCVDDRIDAVAEFAGIVLALQNKPSPDPKVTDRPLLIIHGTKDGTVVYKNGEDTFAKVKVPRWFITLPDAPHIPPYLIGRSGPQPTVVVDATLDFLDAELKGDTAGIDRMEAVVAKAGPKVATIKSAG
ncbi:MAG: alpha/beta hydrolase family protein [Acidimicrobiales bacterium]